MSAAPVLRAPPETSLIRYPRVLQLVHMSLALLMCAQFILILVLHQLQSVDFGKFVLSAHRQCGALVLCLALSRLALGFWHRPPKSPENSPTWQSLSARAVHLAMILLLVAQPALGFVSTWSRGDTVVMFGFLKLPALVQLTSEQGQSIAWLHSVVAIALVSLVGVHLGAIVFNRVVRKTTSRFRPLSVQDIPTVTV